MLELRTEHSSAREPLEEAVLSRILVAQVGFNPFSVLIASRVLEPDRVVLLHTTDTARIANTLAIQVDRDRTLVAWDGPPCMQDVVEPLAEDVGARPDDEVIVDITGGTKELGLGVWIGLESSYGAGLRGVSLNPAGHLTDVHTSRAIPGGAWVDPKEPPAWRGAHLRKVVWQGRPNEIDADVRRRADLTNQLFARYRSGTRPKAGTFKGLPVQHGEFTGELPAPCLGHRVA